MVLATIAVCIGLGLIVTGRLADGPYRYAWLMLGIGSMTWGTGLFVFSRVADRTNLNGRFIPLHLGWAALCLGVSCAIHRLGKPYTSKEERRKLVLDLMPTVIALIVVVWLVVFGSDALNATASWRLRVAAGTHGLGAFVLLVVALAGGLRPVRPGQRSVVRILSLAAALLAVSDLVWLQPWIGGESDNTLLAQIGFLSALIAFAGAASRARGTFQSDDSGAREDDEPFAMERMHLIPYFSLFMLIVLTWIQLRGQELQPHGTEISLIGSLAVVVFVMIRQGLTHRHARVLRGEIGQLTEQIDDLIEQVGRDPLTALLNRRAVMARIDHELVHARTFGHPLAVALIDVDNFKTVNDTLGHQAGDRVLLAVGSILSSACRGTDVAARYAGDEFLLVLPGLNEGHAFDVCARIVNDVRRLADELDFGGVRVTLSVGAAVTHRCKRTAAQLIEIADAAMYDAKEGGKDRVVAVDADTLLQPGNQPLSAESSRGGVTYLPAHGTRAIGDERREISPQHLVS